MMIRKFAVVAAVLAASVAFAAEPEQDVSDQGEGAVGWTAAQIGLFAPVSYPWGCDWDVCGADLNLLYLENARLQGVGLSFGATRTRDTLKGLVLSSFLNWGDKDVYGVNIALIGLNYVGGDVYGFDWGFFGMRQNMCGIDCNFLGAAQQGYRGLQLGGACNVTYKEFRGVDVTLGLNFACEQIGAQIGGVNFAHRFKGCQVGLINIAEECPNGIQIGLVNIIMDNTIKALPLVNWYFD